MKKWRGIIVLGALSIVAAALSGCATVSDSGPWGRHVDFTPGFERMGQAAVKAAKDPWVWAPLAGAALLQVNEFDERVSDWASDRTPIFGSQDQAETWSNRLRSAAVVINFSTALAADSGDDAEEWFRNKAKGVTVELAAIGATSLVVKGLKQTTSRERPNAFDRQSFPSGHASTAAVNTRLAIYNLETIDMNPNLRRSMAIGFDVLNITAAWARIEAQAHYPSDVLAGMAIGNFFAVFANEAFLNPDDANSRIAVSMLPKGAMLSWETRF